MYKAQAVLNIFSPILPNVSLSWSQNIFTLILHNRFESGTEIMRILALLLLCLFASQTAYAKEDMKKYVDFQARHITKMVELIDIALKEAAETIERNPDKEELFIHDSLKNYVERTPALRAIIHTDEKGILRTDSITYPAKNIDLHDREYVKHSLNSPQQELYIGSAVLGRSSGTSFIPFSRPLMDAQKNPIGVVAGIMHPGFLLRQDLLCPQCFAAVFNTNGKVLVSYPSNAQYPDDYIAALLKQQDGAPLEYVLEGQKVQSQTIHLKKSGLSISISAFSKK